MFGEFDITFCANKECKKTSCRRHRDNIPYSERWISMSEFKPNEDGTCQYYWGRKN